MAVQLEQSSEIKPYRISLDEIESALRDCAGIKEAVVVARNNNSGDERLIAYYVPTLPPGPDVGELRTFLRAKLPEYMIPAAFVALDSIPLTVTRKIDRKALPDPGTSRPETGTSYVAPRSSIERDLAGIWAEVLGVDEIGIHDDFFALGGHSLAAARIISRVIGTFQLELSITALFDSPTIGTMAAVIAGSAERKASEADGRRLLSGGERGGVRPRPSP